jgi:dTMP kinase
MNRKGLLISFEGIDFSGKSTQINKLTREFALREIPFLVLREPGGTEIGERIRKILLDRKASAMVPESELLLYSAARAQLVRESVAPRLSEGSIVILDRFYDSTVAYQGYGRGLDLEQLRVITRFAVGEYRPDITFYLHLEPGEMSRRKSQRGEEEDRMEANAPEFFRKVIEGYRRLSEEEPDRVVLIDAGRPIETIYNEITDILRQRFGLFALEER